MNRNSNTRGRKALFVAATAATSAACAMAAAPMALANDPSASLQVSGPGTAFTATSHLVSQAVKSGSAASYVLRVTNTGAFAAAYYFKLAQSGHASTISLTTTVTNIWGQTSTKTISADSNGNYATGFIAAGKSQDFTLTVTPDKSNTQTSNVDAALYSGSTVEGTESTRTSITAVNGTGAYDILAKQGSQLNVGGAVSGQFATAPALAAKGSATYTIRLQNDGSALDRIGLAAKANSTVCGTSFPAKYTVTSTNILGQTSTTDVTSDVNSGSYLTPYLQQGQYQDITVTISRADNNCSEATYTETTLNGAGTAQMTAVLVANASV